MYFNKLSVWFKVFSYFAICVSAVVNSDIPEARRFSNDPVLFGNYEVHYSAFNSTFLSPQIASAYKLERGSRYGIVNVSILDVEKKSLGKAVAGRIKGRVINLLSQSSGLDFNEVREGDAIYYLASFRFSDDDSLIFKLDVQPVIGGKSMVQSINVEFRQQFFER